MAPWPLNDPVDKQIVVKELERRLALADLVPELAEVIQLYQGKVQPYDRRETLRKANAVLAKVEALKPQIGD
jgi:hypothetical protein